MQALFRCGAKLSFPIHSFKKNHHLLEILISLSRSRSLVLGRQEIGYRGRFDTLAAKVAASLTELLAQTAFTILGSIGLRACVNKACLGHSPRMNPSIVSRGLYI